SGPNLAARTAGRRSMSGATDGAETAEAAKGLPVIRCSVRSRFIAVLSQAPQGRPTRAPGLGGQGQIAAFRPVDLPLPAPGVPAGAVVGTVNLMSRIAHLGGTTPTSRDFSGKRRQTQSVFPLAPATSRQTVPAPFAAIREPLIPITTV